MPTPPAKRRKANPSNTATTGTASFSIGLVADVQYADKPDKVLEGRARYYRAALSRLRHAVTECNRADLVAVLHLGDIVDGNCSDAETSKDFSSVLRAFGRLRHPALHVIGNHCHDVGRERLLRELRMESYYEHWLAPGWRLFVLDTTDVGINGSTAANVAEGKRWLAANVGCAAHANGWNGGVGEAQLLWLRRGLEQVRAAGQHAIVAGHMPLLAAAAGPRHLVFNHLEVGALLDEFRDVCPLYVCGHFHGGGYTRSAAGVHHVTVEGIVELLPEQGASHATLTVTGDQLVIDGGEGGGVTSRRLAFGVCVPCAWRDAE